MRKDTLNRKGALNRRDLKRGKHDECNVDGIQFYAQRWMDIIKGLVHLLA